MTIKLYPPAAVAFFREHAVYSYDPKTETREQGRQRCAEALAEAESTASAHGLFFRWEIDPDCDSSQWSKKKPIWSLWQCTCYSPSTQILATIGGVDFGRDGEPWGNHYRRVIEAELATEALQTYDAR